MYLHAGVAVQGDHSSFIGGRPKLPVGSQVPSCLLCGAQQAFFFQLAMPDGGVWGGVTVAVYQCTSCVDEGYLIPEMLDVSLAGCDVSGEFLSSYQRNFAFVVFPTRQGVLVRDYVELIAFSPLRLTGERAGAFGVLGGKPEWVLEDEAPGSYEGCHAMKFLFQVLPGFEFKLTKRAPPQVELGLTGEPEDSPNDYYQLFVGNSVYAFGADGGSHAVYAITQV